MSKYIDEQRLMDLAEQVGLASDSAQKSTPAGSAGATSSDPRRFSSARGFDYNAAGNDRDRKQALARAEAAAEAMKGKSEEEILAEIMRLKSKLLKNPGAYQKQLQAVKSLRGMMNPKQQQRLDRVLKLLDD